MRTKGVISMNPTIARLMYLTDQILAQELPLSHPHMALIKPPRRTVDTLRRSCVVHLVEGMVGLYPECPDWSVFLEELIRDYRRNKNCSTLGVMFTESLIPTHGKGINAPLNYPRRCRMVVQGILDMYGMAAVCEETMIV